MSLDINNIDTTPTLAAKREPEPQEDEDEWGRRRSKRIKAKPAPGYATPTPSDHEGSDTPTSEYGSSAGKKGKSRGKGVKGRRADARKGKKAEDNTPQDGTTALGTQPYDQVNGQALTMHGLPQGQADGNGQGMQSSAAPNPTPAPSETVDTIALAVYRVGSTLDQIMGLLGVEGGEGEGGLEDKALAILKRVQGERQ